MIIEALISLLGGLIHTVLGLLPTSSGFAHVAEATAFWDTLVGDMKAFGAHPPFDALIPSITLLVGLDLIILTTRSLLFIYHQFWGSG